MASMNKTMKILLLLMLAAGHRVSLAEDSAARRQTLDRMGELNGVALACRYFDQTRRIKQALIEGLPKRRELGQAFDDRTNDAFKAFVGSGQPCPSPVGFAAEVEQAIEALNRAYGAAEQP